MSLSVLSAYHGGGAIKGHIVDTSFVSFRPPQAAGVNHGAVSPLPNKTALLVLSETPDEYAF